MRCALGLGIDRRRAFCSAPERHCPTQYKPGRSSFAAPGTRQPRRMVMPDPTPAKTILVVEDEPDVCIFLANLLAANGFYPVCAATLAEGLRQANTCCPDLVIINAMLPGEAGLRLYQRLRCSDRLCDIPVIMLSTLDKATFLRWPGVKRSSSGRQIPEPDAYLQKPPEADELLAVVNRCCARQ